jgi:hypothetical protein
VNEQVKPGKENLAEVIRPDVDISTPYDPFDEFLGEWFLRYVVAAYFREHHGLPAPVLKHLRGRLDEVAGDLGTVEAEITSSGEQGVECMTHLMEEGHHVVVGHECRYTRGRLCKVSNHGRHGALPIIIAFRLLA